MQMYESDRKEGCNDNQTSPAKHGRQDLEASWKKKRCNGTGRGLRKILVVISKADKLDAVLISLNGDFADIVSYPPEKYKGIISLQIRNHPEVIPLLISKLKDYF